MDNQFQSKILIRQNFTDLIGTLLERVVYVKEPTKFLSTIQQVVMMNEMIRDAEATIVTIETINHELSERLNESVEQYDLTVSQLRREKAEFSDELELTRALLRREKAELSAELERVRNENFVLEARNKTLSLWD